MRKRTNPFILGGVDWAPAAGERRERLPSGDPLQRDLTVVERTTTKTSHEGLWPIDMTTLPAPRPVAKEGIDHDRRWITVEELTDIARRSAQRTFGAVFGAEVVDLAAKKAAEQVGEGRAEILDLALKGCMRLVPEIAREITKARFAATGKAPSAKLRHASGDLAPRRRR